eukprot:5087414-Pleurochrysis_carterae.AAC.1
MEVKTPATAAEQPDVQAVAAKTETPDPAAMQPDAPAVFAETKTETPAQNEVQLVDSDAEVAQFVAEN